MQWKIICLVLLSVGVASWLLEGCGATNPPIGPASDSTLIINVPTTSNIHSKFVGGAQNTVLYCVSGSGKPVTGSFGPISGDAVTNSMSFSVTLQGSISSYKLIALQINDASSGVPLAFGAAPFTSSNVSIELGPMESGCYAATIYVGESFSFENPNDPVTIDAICNYTPDGVSGYELDNPTLQGNSIAYMGNGNLVDFASVPPSSSFQVSSSVSKGLSLGGTPTAPVSISMMALRKGTSTADFPMQTNDVYCVQMTSGGYAWVQITNPGSIDGGGPSFVFRLNTTVPYCAYEQSQGDLNNDCTVLSE